MNVSSRHVVFALLMLLVIARPANLEAWNYTGHKTVAFIAYVNLTDKARAAVDTLLMNHPDYAAWTDSIAQPLRGLNAFMIASIFPDIIKGDKRFFNGYKDARPTPLIDGFPDMDQHRSWHYINIPLSLDGAPTREPEIPNAVSKVRDILRELTSDTTTDAHKAYYLTWLLHLVGDLHQPLHTVARFSDKHPDGDQGGNLVLIDHERKNLHSYWDGLLGRDDMFDSVVVLGARIMHEISGETAPITEPSAWMDEGVDMAQDLVYSFTMNEAGTMAIIDDDYDAKSRTVARQRVAAAGYRLAAIINQVFGR